MKIPSLKTILPKTLFARSLLILIIPIFLIQVIASHVFIDRHWSKMTSRLAFAVAGEIAWIASSIEHDNSHDNIKKISTYASSHLDLLLSYSPSGSLPEKKEVQAGVLWESMVVEKLAGEIKGRVGRPFVLYMDFQEKWVEVIVELDNGILEVSLPQRRLFSSSGYVFLLWMIAVSLVLLAIAILFMRNQIRPIHRLAVAVERFGKGRDVAQFKPSGAIEVRKATEAFFDMRRRLQRQISQRTTMLAGVSHDLRTPLTRLKLQLEMLPENSDIKAMKQDVSDMNKMIEGYLAFVKGEGEEQPSLTDIDQLIEDICNKNTIQNVKINIEQSLAGHMMIRPISFARCLSNIIENAKRYADTVWVNAQRITDKLEICIEDNGPGIEKSNFEDVFKPFFRVDSSRNSETGGVGLGLPIAMDIVHAHGGKIELADSEKGGLKVIIRLPL